MNDIPAVSKSAKGAFNVPSTYTITFPLLFRQHVHTERSGNVNGKGKSLVSNKFVPYVWGYSTRERLRFCNSHIKVPNLSVVKSSAA